MQGRLAQRYLTDNFTDVVINLSYIVLGWLAGGGDFGRSICAAVNAGQDTDCTGATLGALLGILDPEAIDARWLASIGRQIVLSESVRDVTHPQTIDGLTAQVLNLRRRLGGQWPRAEDAPQETSHLAIVAEIGYADAPTLPTMEDRPLPPASMRPVCFPGHFVAWPAKRCGGEQVWVRYRVRLSSAQTVNVLFNTPEPMRLWVDGRGVLSRDGGSFVPAMHRPREANSRSWHSLPANTNC